ncbi:uncharacterized protein LOC124192494 [Daphnia pulex]|uniref:uncharacterized protein LOC124192494 n=1 Tax=Daphnia pulex TaxID=6669 RepID=UPI001EE1475E|nr:uncharacterized protein LOC124192494 [Daphnia pulex]XP_046648508.1 uncharacterized protein LOC124338467 [Daphnia pulicaria]
MTARISSCILLLSFFASITAGQRISTAKIGDNRYFISWQNPYAPRLNFHLAYQYCRTIAMELISLESAEEAQQLADYLRPGAAAADFWTSGNTLGTSTWLWLSNGSPFNGTFNYWPNGLEPNRSTDSNCLLVTDQTQTWRAENCAQNNHFICEQTRCYFYNFNPFAALSTSPQGNSAR